MTCGRLTGIEEGNMGMYGIFCREHRRIHLLTPTARQVHTGFLNGETDLP